MKSKQEEIKKAIESSKHCAMSAPVDWPLYRIRDAYSLFELACLVNRLDPESVHNDAFFATRHGGTIPAEILMNPLMLSQMMFERPSTFFLHPVGNTLERMKKAAGNRLGMSIAANKAHDLALALGYAWPDELCKESPNPASKEAEQTPPPEPVQAAPASAEQDKSVQTMQRARKKETLEDFLMPYLVKVFRSGAYSSGKELHKALVNKAGADDSPFKAGTGRTDALYVTKRGQTLAAGTLNKWMGRVREEAAG